MLVTGAGGFLASRMAEVFAASGAERIVLLEIAEQALFGICSKMTAQGWDDRCIPVLGSVCDHGLLQALFEEHRPDYILHAAALKHVPLMERNPFAAVATNAIGSWTLAKAAEECGIPRVLLLSTDKAVAPRSIMGASKRIAEMAVLARGFTAVRLVNVLGSPSSVGPIFAEQIERGGPATVTHRAARRFFLTLEEVTGLLAEAIAVREPEGLFVPDPGEPVLITELAQRMIQTVRGAAEPRAIPVVFTEPRPGDKLEELLVGESERVGEAVTSGLRQVLTPPMPEPEGGLRSLAAASRDRNLDSLLREVRKLVADYEPSILLRQTIAGGVAQ
jgi:FlaA1/EpsC-like NDP-sugar epimerase